MFNFRKPSIKAPAVPSGSTSEVTPKPDTETAATVPAAVPASAAQDNSESTTIPATAQPIQSPQVFNNASALGITNNFRL